MNELLSFFLPPSCPGERSDNNFGSPPPSLIWPLAIVIEEEEEEEEEEEGRIINLLWCEAETESGSVFARRRTSVPPMSRIQEE